MSRFFIKQISVTGEKVLFSEVSFNDGVNIIYGPSNAGKSYIINCINFMFAGDPPFTKSSTGYDTVTMTMESDDGYAISMTRKIIDLNTIMLFNLMKYLEENAIYAPHLLILDSPILSLKEKKHKITEKEKATPGMRESLFKYIVNHCWILTLYPRCI